MINVPRAANKTMGPSTCAVFLGIQLDAYASVIKKKLDRNHCTLTEFKSLLGKLQFTCCIMTTRRFFLRRVYDKTFGLTNDKANIRLDEESKLDLKVWESFLSTYNGRTLLSFTHFQSTTDRLSEYMCSSVILWKWVSYPG